jgi:predicted transposase/invertase (TIGR01784 family)
VPRTLLDPKLDVVFKLLFADERNRGLLISLLTAILEPPEPITGVTVLNPDTPKETVVDKGAILDLRVRLRGGAQINVEMQAARHPGLRQRALFYWARLYTSQIGKGDHYVQLTPALSIFILDFVELETTRYHSHFRLLERHDHTRFSDDLALHVLELPKLPRAAPDPADAPVLRWAKFFTADPEELELLAMTAPDIHQAKSALERLSSDPAAQELARERELAAWNYEHTLHVARQEAKAEGEARGRAEGEARGRAEGEAKGRAAGLRAAVSHLCAAYGIELTPARRAELERADADALQKLVDSIAANRTWP